MILLELFLNPFAGHEGINGVAVAFWLGMGVLLITGIMERRT